MAAANADVKNLIYGFVAVLIGVILVPIVDAEVTAAGFTGTLGSIMSLVPVLFGLVILLGIIYNMFK